MKKRPAKNNINFSDLRKTAEAKLEKQTDRLRALSKEETDRLVHELGTHQIELEIQNEELRRAQEEIEESRRKYADLFDFAPVGYFTIARDGMILDVNHTGGVLLGKNKRSLVSHHLSDFIVPQDLPLFQAHFDEVFAKQTRQTCEARLRRWGRGEFYARLESITAEGDSAHPVGMRTAVIDITDRKQAELAVQESEERYRSIFNNNHAVMLLIDPKTGMIVDANPAACAFYGYAKERLTSMRITMINTLPERETLEALEKARFALEGRFYFRHRLADGEVRDVEVFTGTILAKGQTFLYSIIHDITERKEAEERLRLSEERFRAIFEKTGVGIVITTTERLIIDCNPIFLRMLGYTKEELIGKHAAMVTHPDDEPGNVFLFKRTLEERRDGFRMQKRYVRKDGSVLWGDLVMSFVYDTRGEPEFIVAMITDVTEHRKMEETIRYQAHHDALTSLPNRLLFTDLLSNALAQAHRNKKILAVMFLDLDRFKVINDTMGHSFGDKLLQAVGETLRQSVRESDIIARIGGDEFTILLPSVAHAEDAAKIAQKIMQRFNKPFPVDDHELHVTTSIGISLYPNDGEHAETLLKNADIAMYHVKEFGRNSYAFYNPAMNVRTLERMILENSLRQTLQRGELVVYYQPQLDIRTKQIVCNEALVRWRHPELGMLNPMQFLPLAEETGFIMPMDEWVLRTACEQSKQLQEAGYPSLCVTVNLSSRQFQQTNLVEMVEHALHDTGLDARYLFLEVTESAAMQDMEITYTNLTRLAQIGVKCSIDDFGTGYSSLSYLKRLPLQSLKIDKSFVRDIAIDPDDKAIITAIVAMAHSLKMKVIAEGVETEEQLDFLQSIDCDEMQGFLITEPLPVEELKKVIELYH